MDMSALIRSLCTPTPLRTLEQSVTVYTTPLGVWTW